MLYGCCGLGDAPLQSRFPWGYLGQDTTDYVDFGPDVPPDISVGDVANAAASGGSSWLDSLGNVLQKAGTSVDQILQQYQVGQLASNMPISQLPQLRAAITGQTTVGSIVSQVASSPVLLIGGALVLFLLLRKGK